MSYPETLRDLIARLPRAGRLEAIVLRPGKGQPAQSVAEVRALPGWGLQGDRRAVQQRDGSAARKRELSLIQAEHLPMIAQWSGLATLDATRLRRNLIISGINLLAMKSPFKDVVLQWQIGAEVCIQVTGPCEPCSKMEAELGPGGYNAMRGHGGMTALIITGGVIRVGDAVSLRAVMPS